MKVLIIGRTGQLAGELLRASWTKGTELVALGRPNLDVTIAADVDRAFEASAPDIVINASAYTAVDRAESDRASARELNAVAPQTLARAASRRRIPLIHVSTDYVFDGTGDRPWREDDPVAPRSVYGATKLDGERRIRETLDEHIIVRTSWLFAAFGQNFVRTMLRLAETHSTLRVVDDQLGCPTPAADLARVIACLSSQVVRGEAIFGTYHYCGTGAVSWLEFARSIFENAGDTGSRTPRLEPITTTEFGAAAARPRFSVLDCSKIARDYGVHQRAWSEGLKDVLQVFKEEKTREVARTS